VAPVHEWGGIAYALAGLDAALDPDWQIVPLIKVGHDLAPQAERLLGGFEHLIPGGRCQVVPVENNRVTLRYTDGTRRCERMSGGVPGWTWAELGPMVRDLDAIYLNFVSGFELCLGTATALRHGFAGPIYADLHSLLLGFTPDGVRTLQPLAVPRDWFACFNTVQVNEEEMQQIGPDPLAVAAVALDAGVSLLNVTLGARGVAYVERPADGSAARTALLPAPAVDVVDPTGCGDVFGATCCARLLAGEPVPEALHAALRAASRNATFRGASGLVHHLRGRLVVA
jgi:hypothetical protein